MKKLLIAAFMMLGLNGMVTAQQTAPKAATTTDKKTLKKVETGKVVPMDKSKHVAATGLKADGTPDMRLKENKNKAKTTAPVTGPTKKDGSPDMRYKANKKKP